MKILQINVTANSGSTGRIAEGIGIAAQRAGFNSWIAYGRYANRSSSQLIKIGSTINIYGHAIESRLFDNHGLASRYATISFLEKVDRINPDLIHLHNIHGYYINYKRLFQYLHTKKIPVVWTLHDCWPFTGHCTHFTFCGCARWKTGCYSCPQKKKYPSSYFLDKSEANYKNKKESFNSIQNCTIISVSKWLDGVVSQSFFKNHVHAFIYNGIDTHVFSPSNNTKHIRNELGIKDDELMIIGVASTWNDRKGLYDYIELSKHLLPQQKIVLIGLSKKQLMSLPSNIVGIERTESTKQLAEYYSASDVVLNLSQEETFGMTTVEGFSCGTPGIGYNCTATPELFTPDTGYVVSSGDYSGLLDCIKTIQEKGKQAYSQACRNHALAHFRAEDCFQKYINLYQTVLS